MKIEIALETYIPSIQKLGNEFIKTELNHGLKTNPHSYETNRGINYIKSFIKKHNKIVYVAKNSIERIIGFAF